MTARASCGCSSHNGFLTAKGLEEAEQRRAASSETLEVAGRQLTLYLDKVGSVRALVEVEDDATYDSHHSELNESFVHPQGG